MASFPDQHPTQRSEDTLYKLRKDIFKAAMRREWKRVRELYQINKLVCDQKITSANDTVLHVAISGASQYTILKLLEVIEEGPTPSLLYLAKCCQLTSHNVAELDQMEVTSQIVKRIDMDGGGACIIDYGKNAAKLLQN